MTNDSTPADCAIKEPQKSIKRPKLSTVNFIRQFSRAYVAVSGMALNQMICN